MTLYASEKATAIDQQQSRLMQLAALFLLFYSVILSLAPAVRLNSWDVTYRWNHWIGFLVWTVGSTLVHHQLIRRVPDRDPYLFPGGMLLAGWGLLSIWRLDSSMGARQTAWLAVSLLVFTAGLRFPGLLTFLRRYKYLWLTSGLLLTGLTFLFGTYPGGVGPHLWLGCCGMYLQPSEPLKLLLIIYLAAYLADQLPVSFSLVQLLTPTLILIGAALFLLTGQRDLGTAFLFILIYSVVVFIASGRKRTLVISLIVLLAAGLAGYLMFDVVRIRVDAWVNPWNDPAGRSYQIIQSVLAVASGGIFGHGPGMGSPGVVPVAHSDFIFASIMEESGLLGAIGLLALFALIIERGFRAALYSSSNYRRYLAAGITSYLAIQAIFIIGGNLRLLPLTGVTLPFLSYGGSSLLTAFLSLLILLVISSHGEEEPAPLLKPAPFIFISSVLLVSLLALAVLAGWWSAVRNTALLERPENPRRVVTDRFVPRGSILDRNNNPIAVNTGSPGSYQRQYEYPPLSDTIGYNSPLYGQAGLEAGLDAVLRGMQGYPATQVLVSQLIYGQPPPGINLRLTIDLQMQKKADNLFQGHKGALVLLNANTGEILAMVSYPNFDPNQLDQNWPGLLQNPDAPLLNRATQGSYPPGTALGPFLLSYANSKGNLPPLTADLTYANQNGTWSCAFQPEPPYAYGQVIADGCPGPIVKLGSQIGAQTLSQLLFSLGFYDSPDLPLVTANPSSRGIGQVDLSAIGQDTLNITPLQMAIAAAAISNNGIRPSPVILQATEIPQQDWLILPHNPGQDTMLSGGTEKTAQDLMPQEAQFWQTTALARSTQEELTWFLAGTTPQWKGTPLALALILEEKNPELARHIGQSLMNETRK